MNEDKSARDTLGALARYMQLRRLEAELAENDSAGPVLTVTRPDTGAALDVVCWPRADDGGRLWLMTCEGTPLAEADQLINAGVAVMGLLPPLDVEIRR